MNFRLPLSFLQGQDGLRLDQYFGLWCVDDVRFLQMLRQVERMDLAVHVREGGFDGAVDEQRAAASVTTAEVPQSGPRSAANAGGNETPVRDKGRIAQIAIISLRGVMTKYGSSLSTTGSTVRLRRALRQAARSDDVDGILLHIDSPGGTAAGTADLAQEVAAANARKPVFGFCEDLTASAAYWVASPCQRLFANAETALVGSIGTWIGLYDLSQMAEREGIRAIVIKAGEMKGLGFPGSAITADEEAYLQDIVTKTQSQFTQAVAEGRSMAEADVPVTGKLYMARDAQRLGLIDGIQSLDETLSQLAAAVFERREAAGATTANTTADAASAPAMLKHKNKPRAQVTEVDEGEDQAAAPESRIVTDTEEESISDDASTSAQESTEAEANGSSSEAVSEQSATSESEASSRNDAPATDSSDTQDRIAQLERELAQAKADAEEAQARSAAMQAEKQQTAFRAFAREHRQRTLPANTERVVAVLEALAAYDAAQATGDDEESPSALDQFKALVAALPVQYTLDVDVTGDAAPNADADVPTVSVPEGANVDPERLAMAHRIQAYAQQHGLTYAQALAQIGDEVLTSSAE